MRELVAELVRLRAAGPVGRAVVVGVTGSAPRPAGAVLLATPSLRFAGSLAGGCVEGATVEDIAAVVAAGAPALRDQPLIDRVDPEHPVCGGALRTLLEPCVRPELEAMAAGDRGGVLVTVLSGPAFGAAFTVDADDAVAGPLAAAGAGAAPSPDGLPSADAVRALARDSRAAGRCRTAHVAAPCGEVEVFAEVVPPRPRLVLWGATDVSAAIVALARPLGWSVAVADARAAFVDPDRFRGADVLVRAWPDEAFARIAPDAGTAICVQTHDPKLDEPALAAALRTPACYVGLMGSRRTQARHRARLRAAGFGESDVARVRGPIGLDLGGHAAPEVALAILAEIVAARRGGTGRPLVDVRCGNAAG